MKNIKNIFIVAGGTNSRFQQLSIFPKLLLPIEGHKSILQNDVEAAQGTQVTILMNSQYFKMTEQYVKELGLDAKLIEATNTNGSMNTIKKALQEHRDEFPDDATLVVWSDLIVSPENISHIDDALDGIDKEDGLVVFTKVGDYRLGIGQDSKVHPELKNIPGIFWYAHSMQLNDYVLDSRENYDFAEWMCSTERAVPVSIEDEEILELRDLETYKKYIAEVSERCTKDVTRFFNKISVEDGVLTKKCTVPSFAHLIEKEKRWYAEAPSEVVPKIHPSKEGEIKMEYVKGVTFEEWIANREKLREEICDSDDLVDKLEDQFFEKYWEALDVLHEKLIPVPKPDLLQDLRREFYDKVVERCNKISHILCKYDEQELKKKLERGYKVILDWFNDKYTYSLDHPGCLMVYSHIHGDLNGSNVLVSDEGGLKFIDPRGYFGLTVGAGPREYDYAKILYALSGYDKFNRGYSIYNPEKRTDVKPLSKHVPEKLDKHVYRVMVAIIWIALAEYISADVMKANIAYEHGMELLAKET